MRTKTIRQSAELACRSPPGLSRWRRCLPEEASTGLAPQSAAKLASEASRSGLSPTVVSRVVATWRPTPCLARNAGGAARATRLSSAASRSEEHTSELQSRVDLVCRLRLEKKK